MFFAAIFQLQKRHDQMRRSLEQQIRELEDKRRIFEAEKMAWESQTGQSIEELRRRSLEANSKEWVKNTSERKKFSILFLHEYKIIIHSLLIIAH